MLLAEGRLTAGTLDTETSAFWLWSHLAGGLTRWYCLDGRPGVAANSRGSAVRVSSGRFFGLVCVRGLLLVPSPEELQERIGGHE